MLDLMNVTLLAVTSVRIDEAIWALRRSCKGIQFGGVKLLTHEAVEDPVIQVEKIEHLDYDGYSRFIVYNLHRYFETDFVLLVQDDGYVVNPSSWREEFLEYDYIGAPWAEPRDGFSYTDQTGRVRRVGNGGFSLRSRRLCRLASELEMPWEPFHGYYHEDGFICVNNAHIYEGHGCVIAPLGVARYFSHEAPIPEIAGIIPFGFHGKSSKYYLRHHDSAIRRVKRSCGRLVRMFGGFFHGV